jgi:hypothetical protein
MSNCSCSETVRQNWGSQLLSDGSHKCLFCEGMQNAEQVRTESSDGEDPKQPKDQEFPIKWERPSTRQAALATGGASAERVFRYGTLFENVGKAIQYLNTIGAILVGLIVLFLDLPGGYKVVGLLLIGLIWALSFLQTSFIRGLASYFQMRSADYLHRHPIDESK